MTQSVSENPPACCRVPILLLMAAACGTSAALTGPVIQTDDVAVFHQQT
jgi:hypothetical protein